MPSTSRQLVYSAVKLHLTDSHFIYTGPLPRRTDRCTEKATAALRQKRKELALSYIRSRKQLEDLLKRRLGSLETLQATLLRVEAAAGDIEVRSYFKLPRLALPPIPRDAIIADMSPFFVCA